MSDEIFGRIRSLKRGDDPEARRIHKAVAAPTSTPTDRKSFQHAHGGKYLHLYAHDVAAVGSLVVAIFYYSDIAGQVFPGPTGIDLKASGGHATIEIQGEDLVHVQVTAVAGGSVDIWGGVNFGGQ